MKYCSIISTYTKISKINGRYTKKSENRLVLIKYYNILYKILFISGIIYYIIYTFRMNYVKNIYIYIDILKF